MAKPVLGTKGDDVLEAEPEFVSIYGKKGFDVVHFEGSYDDYTITTKSTGNYKTTVSGNERAVELKQIEMLRFDEGSEDRLDDTLYDIVLGTTIRADGTLHPDAVNPATGDPYHGTGNDPDNYVIVDHEARGLQLGLQIKERGGPSYDPVAFEDDGTVRFEVESGPQNVANPNRADWNFDYSIATGLNGDGADLSSYTFKLLVDIDPTSAVAFREFTMVDHGGAISNATGFVWVDQDDNVVIADDGGNSNVAQNSQNYAFGFIHNYIDADPDMAGQQSYAPDFGPAEFHIRLEAYNGNDLIAFNQVVVDVMDIA